MLSISEQTVFNLASPTSIINALSRASTHFKNDNFLSSQNSFKAGVAKSVKNLLTSTNSPFVQPDLVESIAVSGILHLYDGWSYLAQALKASFRSDDAIARHLAYYGELRAAFSILASHGIGIYSNSHIVVDASERVHKFSGQSTHKIAWSTLEAWGKTGNSGILIGQEINAFGHSLSDWVVAFQGTSTPAIIGADWVESWGIDLNSLSLDQLTRNEVSYGADFDYSKPKLTPESIQPWLHELWTIAEPGGASFEVLDKYLVRSTLESIFNTKFKDQNHSEEQSKNHLHEKMMDACIAMNINSNEIIDFFIRDKCQDDLLIMQLARNQSSVHAPLQYREVMSRTYLLLRLATAGISSLLRGAHLCADDLSFWWVKTCETSGLWNRDIGISSADDIRELWADVSLSLENFKELLDENPIKADDWYFFNHSLSGQLENLSRLEKLALWGIS